MTTILVATPAHATSLSLEPGDQRRLAAELFNYVWALLEQQERSDRENSRMIDAAHASRFFWEQAGEPVNHARGEWQISRVYATVGRTEPAIHHARLCLEICEQHGLGAFDLGYAYEALARSLAAAGDLQAAADYSRRAQECAGRITDRDDRALLLDDLTGLPSPAHAD
ncbi:MAG: hypothetical protein ACP5H2_02365 [Solirubrobacteraceae bacterium]